MDKVIITSASNKYFPSVLNLIGSIYKYSDIPVVVYDLGLLPSFRKELELMSVRVIKMPHFCSFWRSCYTWKTYITAHPLARLNFYVDAGCEFLRPFDEIWDFIERDDYFFVDQGGSFKEVVPTEYKRLFDLKDKFDELPLIAAGIIGFKKDSKITQLLEDTFTWGKLGFTLGFSKNDLWRNKGKDKTTVIQDCPLFRHDLTVLNWLMRIQMQNPVIHDGAKYAGGKDWHPQQTIWNFRMVYKKLRYLKPKLRINRILIGGFMILKKIQ